MRSNIRWLLYTPQISNQLFFLNQTFCKLMDFKVGEILLGGDLNYACDPLLDWANVNIQSKRGGLPFNTRGPRHYAFCKTLQSKLLELFDTYDLVDTWSILYPSAHQYTYFLSSNEAYLRIDFILTSKALFNSVMSADIGLHSLSDHAWVTCLITSPVPVH